MAIYNPKSLKAEEFINDEEIRETLRYAEENKNNLPLIEEILEKARPKKAEKGYVCAGLSHREASVLLACEDPAIIEKIYKIAEEIKLAFYGNRIVIFAPLYLSNYCVNGCLYCPYHLKNKHIPRKKLTQEEVREDGRIHTIFTQTLTRTGRLSSISPNLQNIPARSEYSELIRKAFIPDSDSVLLSSDYSQVELRIFAHMSGEANLIQAFVDNKDIHAKTASDIFHVEEDKVTKDMRRNAKAVNFGILYGISSFGLSEDLGINVKDAKEFIDNYLETYPGIRDYMEKEKSEAYKNGYVKTLMNRKRVIEELNSKNFMIRSSGERMALNTPIQGTAADILKKAMVEIYSEFNKRNLKSKMLIQVHDELVFNVLNEELEEVKEIVRNIMENTFKLDVPLKVDIEYGNNWYEAK